MKSLLRLLKFLVYYGFWGLMAFISFILIMTNRETEGLLILASLLVFLLLKTIFSKLFKKRASKMEQAFNTWSGPDFEGNGGTNFAENTQPKTLVLGMPEYDLFQLLGLPDDKEEHVSINKIKIKYYYGAYKKPRGGVAFRKYILVENGLVVGWGDIR